MAKRSNNTINETIVTPVIETGPAQIIESEPSMDELNEMSSFLSEEDSTVTNPLTITPAIAPAPISIIPLRPQDTLYPKEVSAFYKELAPKIWCAGPLELIKSERKVLIATSSSTKDHELELFGHMADRLGKSTVFVLGNGGTVTTGKQQSVDLKLLKTILGMGGKAIVSMARAITQKDINDLGKDIAAGNVLLVSFTESDPDRISQSSSLKVNNFKIGFNCLISDLVLVLSCTREGAGTHKYITWARNMQKMVMLYMDEHNENAIHRSLVTHCSCIPLSKLKQLGTAI